MSATVLYDKHDLATQMGTGIATYARTLALVAHEAGFNTEALGAAFKRIDRRNPVLSEAELFDNIRPFSLLSDRQQIILRGLTRVPFGVRPEALSPSGTVIQPRRGEAGFARTWLGIRLFDSAQVYFYVFRRLAQIRFDRPPEVFHATQPLPLSVKGSLNIVTIHDLVPLRLPYLTNDNKRYYYNLIRHITQTADHIVTVSEHSRRDIMQIFDVPESRITNIWQASALPVAALARSHAQVAADVACLFDLEPGGYFLFVGALEPKKNVMRLIDAYAISGSARTLVIAGGKGWQNESELERIEDPGFTRYRLRGKTIAPDNKVRRIPYLPVDQLVLLIQGARALLFPSLYEGFGLPVLEAMMLGTPVITSTVSSLPEVAGDAALCVDPYDVAALAAAIRTLDHDDDLCADLAQKGLTRAEFFSMQRYTERVSALYRAVLGTAPAGS